MYKTNAYITDTIALRKIIIDRGIKTQVELSKCSGVDRNTLGKIINGKEQPSSTVMYKLAECLNMDSLQAGTIFLSENLRNKKVKE